MIPKICSVKDCLDDCTQGMVIHHCEIMKSTESEDQLALLCKFNPNTHEDDEFHCIFGFCSKHGDEFRRLPSSEKSKIQFKNDRHKH
jgi:hypothetical protein